MSDPMDDVDIFSFESALESESKKKAELKKVEPVVPIPKEQVSQVSVEKSNSDKPVYPPELRGSDFPTEYIGMVERIRKQYSMLTDLDYDAIDGEISDLSVKSCPTPSLQVLGDEIQKVQAAKDRLSEIFVDVIKVYNYKKRAVDILRDSWGKFTSEKNAEARKGDSAFRLSNFELDFATTEGLLKSVTHIFRNLDSLHDTLSRRITISQLILKQHEFGRTNLPDYDFDKVTSKTSSADMFDKEEPNNKEEGGGPKLESFDR